MSEREDGLWKVRRALTSVLIVVYFIILISGCANAQGEREIQSGRFEFALIGDMPYDARHEKEFANVMKGIDAADLAFVIHNGDFWWDGGSWTEKAGGLPPCSDEAFKDRLRLAQSPDIHSYLFPETTSGPIVTGQSHARMTRSRDSQSSARCFSEVIRVSAVGQCG